MSNLCHPLGLVVANRASGSRTRGARRATQLALGAALALGLGLFTAASARAEGCEEGDGESKQGKFHIEYINGKPVTVIDTEIAVCGKVPRPSVVYVLTAKNIDYEWENLKQDFMPLIINSVKKAPF
jgi:hypothetical protein